MSFSILNLSPELQKALADKNYVNPYPIQQEAIPAILDNKDVLGIAKTGSGKTAAFVLPTLMNLNVGDSKKNRHIKVLVLVPTRELAIQVCDVFKEFSLALPERIKTLAVYGGVSINPQMIAMQGVDILVATAGRLLDLVDSNAVHLSEINCLILDEADKMLNLGFEEDMNRIFALLPKNRQNLLFSATLSNNLRNIHKVLLNNPLIIDLAPELENIDLIQQIAYFVNDDKKGPLLRHLIKENDLKQVLVFTSSIVKADNVAAKLRRNKIDAISIHSKKSQNSRIENLRKFKHNQIRVLVATDLLARGIDIEFLPYVVNYDLPRSPKDYIHRIGRTGRAESPGQAVSFISPDDKHHFKVIQKKMGKMVVMIESSHINFQK